MILVSESMLLKIRCFHFGTRSMSQRVNTVHKRGAMLSQMITNTDKRKHWHYEILQNNSRSRNVFEKVSRPHKRQNVLNALFIRNLTDVLSTGDTIPEILGYGVEIKGVKVSPCCKILNVYWQIPQSSFVAEDKIASALNGKAHVIRAEIISRNLMGRVPQIFFIRDTTNAFVAAFERAIQEVEAELKGDSGIVPDDSFMSKKGKIYKFALTKAEKEKQNALKETDDKVIKVEPTIPPEPTIPERPKDMRTDVFGLDREKLMVKVNALKSKPKVPEKTNVITGINWDEIKSKDEDDLFSKIPGTTVHSDVDREELLKKFHIERKKHAQEKRKAQKYADKLELCKEEEDDEYEEPDFSKFCAVEEDYVDEDIPERF